MDKIIYLDNASKTIPYNEVVEKYNEVTTSYFANPASIHTLGNRANRLLEKTKEEMLSLFKLNNHQVIFTSSATESNNLAIKGYALKYQNRGKHLIVSSYEHPSVLEAVKQLEDNFGFEISYIEPDSSGVISVQKVEESIRKDTILVSIMAVNNEIGSINPIEEIANLLAKYPKIVFHVDACQAVGKMKQEINYKNVDMFTISAHKVGGIIGTAALIKKKNLELLPLLSGGGQEYGLRSSTVNLAGSVAFLESLKISLKKDKEHYDAVSILANHFLDGLKEMEDYFELNTPSEINPYIINFSSKNKKSSVIVEALGNAGIMVSSTSACHSSKQKGSYVVKAIGKSDNIANNTIRVSFAYTNTIEEVDALLLNLKKIVGEIR